MGIISCQRLGEFLFLLSVVCVDCRVVSCGMGEMVEVANACVCCSAGGVTIVGGGGKIDINNTFEERLKLLQDSALPAVRTSLFGKNENRKFYD